MKVKQRKPEHKILEEKKWSHLLNLKINLGTQEKNKNNQE